MHHRVRAIIVQEGKILLIHRFKNGQYYYVFPGGGVEEGETLEQALIRELKEELTLEVEIGEQILELEQDNQLLNYFLIQSITGTPTISGEELERSSEENVYTQVWLELSEFYKIDDSFNNAAKAKMLELNIK